MILKKPEKEELAFWREHLKGAKTDTSNKQVYPEFAKFIHEHFKEAPGILDLGSGAYNTLGSYAGDMKLNVFCTDYLANEYKLLNPNCDVIFADMSNLAYGDDLFDIVHCSNALDHARDPYTAIKEMKRVGKKVFLRHFTNVGKIEQYKGMHKYNIYEKDGHMVIGNAIGEGIEYPEFKAFSDDKFTYSYYVR